MLRRLKNVTTSSRSRRDEPPVEMMTGLWVVAIFSIRNQSLMSELAILMIWTPNSAHLSTEVSSKGETSVDKCAEFGVQIIKIASSDIKDWFLIEKIATTHKPVIISTGGSSLRDLDDVVTFFNRRNIPLAINHCVSLYPSEDGELELNQVRFLIDRYPENVIGFSSHE